VWDVEDVELSWLFEFCCKGLSNRLTRSNPAPLSILMLRQIN
jgi:hypothetical protein